MTDLAQNVTTTTRVEPTVRFRGHTVRAPGFDPESFASAIDRAVNDGLTVSPGRTPTK